MSIGWETATSIFWTVRPIFNKRFVVPLLPLDEAPKAAARLNPVFEMEGQPFTMVTQFATTVPAAELKVRITSLGEHEFVIGSALGMLISGFEPASMQRLLDPAKNRGAVTLAKSVDRLEA